MPDPFLYPLPSRHVPRSAQIPGAPPATSGGSLAARRSPRADHLCSLFPSLLAALVQVSSVA